MALDHRSFSRRQFVGLQQDVIGNANLPYVVHERRESQRLDLAFRETASAPDAHRQFGVPRI
jgi:hypothetical protein